MDAVLNYDVLSQMQKDMAPALVPKMIAIFLEEAGKRMADIRLAAQNKDILRLEDESHSLKSSAATFGADLLQKIAKQIEMACKNNAAADALRLATEIDAVFAATSLAFGHYLDSGGVTDV